MFQPGRGAYYSTPLQAVGDKTVIRIDFDKAAACQFGFVLRPFNLFAPQHVGLSNPCLYFLLNSEGNFQSHRLLEFE